MIWIQICFCSLLIMAALVAWTIHRIKNRRPIHRQRVEHRNPGERAWDDPDQKIAAPQYAVVIKLLTFILAIVGIIGFGIGFYISAQSNKQATTEEVVIEVTEEFLETETPTPEQTATITPTLFVEIEPTVTLTPTPTDDLTVTPYPTYTALPTYTPYPTLESAVIERERIIIVTPVDQQPTAQVYYPQVQSSTYGRVVPDQRGQAQQQVYQPASQQPIYVYPTPQFIIPSWDSYITSTPVPTSTQRPTLGACPVYVENMFMTPTPSATWCYTATPTPTERVIIITSEPIIITNTPLPSATLTLTPAPTQTPYVIIVTVIPTETPMPTFTPEPPATQTQIPTTTDVPTETPMPIFTPEPTATPDEESTHEPTDDN